MHLITWVYTKGSYVYYKGLVLRVKSCYYKFFLSYKFDLFSNWKYVSSGIGPLL